MFRLEDGVSAAGTARALQKAFVASGLHASLVADQVRGGAESSLMLIHLSRASWAKVSWSASPPRASPPAWWSKEGSRSG